MDHDNALSRIFAIIGSPGRAAEQIRERPKWLIAGLIIVLIVGAFTALVQHISGPEQLELFRDTKVMRMMSDEDWELAYEAALDPTALDRLKGALSAGATAWIIVFVYGLLYHLFGKLAGGKATFAQAMGVTYWASIIPYGLGYLIRLPLVFAKQTFMGVSLGFAVLAPKAELISAKYQALYFFGDFFVWWGVAVTIVGFAKICGFTGGKAATVVIMPWILFTALMFGLGRLFI